MTTLRRRWPLLLVLLGVLLVAAGVVIFLRRPQTTVLGPTPSIVTPNPFPSTGSADITGMRVKVDELGIDLPLVEGDGWTVPLYKAAHYPGMKLPGEGQRSMLYAHGQSGMFGPLVQGAPGQHVSVLRPGKATLHYVITEYYPKWSPSDLKWTEPGDHEQVVLLTCTTYNANDPRIIAVAEPDPGRSG